MRNKYQGFTLLEVMIFLGLVAVMAVSGFAYYQQGSSGKNLSREVDLLLMEIKKVKNYAQNGFIFNNENFSKYGLAVVGNKSYLFGENGEDCFFDDSDIVLGEKSFKANLKVVFPENTNSICFENKQGMIKPVVGENLDSDLEFEFFGTKKGLTKKIKIEKVSGNVIWE